jgi:hypothetical protein
MPEFELDDESVSRAERFSSRLMDDLRTVSRKGPPTEMQKDLFSEERYSEQAEGVPISDVVENVGQMAREFAVARRWDGEIPCLKLDDGGVIPISLTEFLGGPASTNWFEFWERFGPFPMHLLWRDSLRFSWSQEEQITMTDVNEVEEGVQRGLKGFLSYRFAGLKKWAEWIHGAPSRGGGNPPPPRSLGSGVFPPPPAVSPGGGLQVQVSCLTPGLRIHVSPAYFISWVYFGSPTTPVAGYVLPGRYIFAGDGPMLPKRKRDPAVFCIPADYHPSLTRF